MLEIRPVRTDEDAQAVHSLAHEFVAWLRRRYPELSQDIDAYLAHQKFEEQIRDVRLHYGPPTGECLLAVRDGAAVGILMLKDLGGGVCEMNRMFVRESARGLGAGRALVGALKARAIEMGFRSMVLSALDRHQEALALYRAEGFEIDDRPRGPGNSERAILMRLDLGAG